MSNPNSNKQIDKKTAIKPFLDFTIFLSILIKNIGMYPPGHVTITRSSERLFELMQEIFNHTPRITLIAMKNSLLINGNILETNKPQVQNFALFLSRRGIASLKILSGLSSEELYHFTQLVLAIPSNSQIHQHKDIQEKIKSFSNIHVREIDLSAMKSTDEDSIKKSESTRESTMIWQKLMLGCLPEEQLPDKDSALSDAVDSNTTGSFSRFLKTYNVPVERLAKSYEEVLRASIHPPAENPGQLAGKQEFFKSLYDTLPELSPDLMDQILSTTFDSINGITDEDSLAEILCCIPVDMIIAILEKAKSNRRELSPPLIKMLSTLTRPQEHPPGIIDTPTQRTNLTWDHIQDFFSKDWYQKYIAQDYAEELMMTSSAAASSNYERPVSFPTDEYMKMLQDETINSNVVSALLALMQGDLNEQVYRDYAGNISEMVPGLLHSGDYGLLGTVYTTLKNHELRKENQDIRNAAANALKAFSEENYSNLLAEIFSKQTGSQNNDLEKLVMLSGSKNISWLIDLYLEQIEQARNLQIFNLLCHFGQLTAREALKKLPGESTNHTIALLKLIQACADGVAIPQIRMLLNNRNVEVRTEAIKALLKTEDPTAITALQKMLYSKDRKMINKALEIIQDYEVKELAPELVAMVKTIYIAGTTLDFNKIILFALGNLGDVTVMPALEKIAFTGFSFTPKNLRRTKEFLYKTLPGYPRSAVQRLIMEGLNSRNKNISSICNKMAASS